MSDGNTIVALTFIILVLIILFQNILKWIPGMDHIVKVKLIIDGPPVNIRSSEILKFIAALEENAYEKKSKFKNQEYFDGFMDATFQITKQILDLQPTPTDPEERIPK